jgi:hypothetical protein
MRVIAAFFGPYAPEALPAPVSVFSHDFKRFERFTKLATSSPLGPSQDAVRQRLRQGFEEQITQLHGDFPTGGDRGGMPCRHHTPRTGTDINESIKTVVDWDIRIDEAF